MIDFCRQFYKKSFAVAVIATRRGDKDFESLEMCSLGTLKAFQKGLILFQKC